MTQKIESTVAMRLCRAFARHGVQVTFGQSLPSMFHLAAAHAGIRQVVYRQENAGGAMADGYARISGKVGVVTAQNGPAATLLVPPMAEALKACIPIIALVQEVDRATSDKNAFQEVDHYALFSGVSKWTRRVDRADRIEDLVDMAFVAATSGQPGPVALLFPGDLLIEDGGVASSRKASSGCYPLDRSVPDPAAIALAANWLAEAEHPLIVAGGGVHSSGAAQALAALQQAAHLPVATTTMGKGAVDESHPLTLGVVGYFMGVGARTRELKSMVDRADVVLLVGNRTNQNGTANWQLFSPSTRFIHLDIAPMEIGRNYEALRLQGDARSGLTALGNALTAGSLSKRKAARTAIEAEIATAVSGWQRLVSQLQQDPDGAIRPELVMNGIDQRIKPTDIVVADASYSTIWIANYISVRRAGQRFITPRGLAGLGWGLPLAIGAQVAEPNARVVCVCGDGGFAHSWAELETLRRLDLPVILIILNNGILGFQKHAEDILFGDHTIACDFAPVDHAAIARACGIRGVRVERGKDLGGALDEAFALKTAVLLDVVTDPAAAPPITYFDGHGHDAFAASNDSGRPMLSPA
jgi:acetolactate synthase-1/2/3 large subunit